MDAVRYKALKNEVDKLLDIANPVLVKNSNDK